MDRDFVLLHHLQSANEPTNMKIHRKKGSQCLGTKMKTQSDGVCGLKQQKTKKMTREASEPS
jgi:hypothetical protein